MRTTYAPLMATLATLASLAAGGPLALAAEGVAASEATLTPAERLEQRLERAEQRIRELEARLERAEATRSAGNDHDSDQARSGASAQPAISTATAAAGSPPASARGSPPPRAVTVTATDGSNTVRLRGNVAIDWRQFGDSGTPAGASMIFARRVRPVVEGVLAGNYEYRLMPDFGSGRASLVEAWVDAHLTPSLALQFGKFKSPLGLERLQKDQFVRFTELGLPSDLEPGRDFGLQASGSLQGGTVNYALGWFDGTLDGSGSESNTNPDLDSDGKRDLVGRLFLQPFNSDRDSLLQGLGFGIGASYVNATGVAGSGASTLLPAYRSPGQQGIFYYRGSAAGAASAAVQVPPSEATIAAGLRRRLAPQAQYFIGPFGLIAQYTMVTQQVQRTSGSGLASGMLGHHAWLVAGSWFLSGEQAAAETFTPRSLFTPGRPGTGAIELVARVHAIRFDAAAFAGGAGSFADPANSVLAARAWGAGFNWYLNGNFKLQFNYEVTQFTGGAATGNRPAERVAITRAALLY
jgi:phosphate-selective porin OprO/OprP